MIPIIFHHQSSRMETIFVSKIHYNKDLQPEKKSNTDDAIRRFRITVSGWGCYNNLFGINRGARLITIITFVFNVDITIQLHKNLFLLLLIVIYNNKLFGICFKVDTARWSLVTINGQDFDYRRRSDRIIQTNRILTICDDIDRKIDDETARRNGKVGIEIVFWDVLYTVSRNQQQYMNRM